MTRAKRDGRRPRKMAGLRHLQLRRTLASVGVAFLAVAALPTAVSDIASAPVSNMDADALPATLLTLSAFAGDPALDDGEADLATFTHTTEVFVQDGSARIMAERGGRVGPRPLAAVQPKFAAGTLLSPSGLLRPGLAMGDAEMRTALAGPMPASSLTRVAAFRRNGYDAGIPSASDQVQVADVGSGKATAKVPAGQMDALQTMAAYAPDTKPGSSSLFDAVLHPAGRDFVPPIGEKDHSWAASILPASSFTEKEQTCLAKGIYFEARGETEKGQAAVAQVILNRVRNPAYPKTICGVVYQNQDWRNRCQFSFACDGIKDVIWSQRAYGTAKRIADEVTRGKTWLPEVGSATHYHATYVRPRWARTMQKVDKIGLHVFYRTFGGGWR